MIAQSAEALGPDAYQFAKAGKSGSHKQRKRSKQTQAQELEPFLDREEDDLSENWSEQDFEPSSTVEGEGEQGSGSSSSETAASDSDEGETSEELDEEDLENASVPAAILRARLEDQSQWKRELRARRPAKHVSVTDLEAFPSSEPASKKRKRGDHDSCAGYYEYCTASGVDLDDDEYKPSHMADDAAPAADSKAVQRVKLANMVKREDAKLKRKV